MLDMLDKKILRELEIDSRQSHSKIARKIGTNKTLVSYRIKRLKKRKIITGFQYISNQVILGKLSFGLLMRFQNLVYADERELINKLAKMNSVSWVTSISGHWDILVVIIEKDICSFNQVLGKIFTVAGHHIKEYRFYVDHEGYIGCHDYLYDKPGSAVKYTAGKLIELKDAEQKTYEILKKQPLSSLLQIAQQLKKSYDTIKDKYNYLKSEKILLRCSPKINISVLGYQNILCLFNLAPDPLKMTEFLESCSKHPQIIRYSRC